MVSKKGARIQARCIIIPIAWIDARFLTAQVEIFRRRAGILPAAQDAGSVCALYHKLHPPAGEVGAGI